MTVPKVAKLQSKQISYCVGQNFGGQNILSEKIIDGKKVFRRTEI